MTSSNRLWIFVTAVLAIGILAGGWFLGVSPKLDEAASTDLNTSTVNALNQQKTLELQSLQKDSANLPAIRSRLAQLIKQLPANSDYPAFLTELNQIAGENSVSVTNVAFEAPTVLAAVAAAPAPGATATATPSPAATAAPPAVVTNVVPPGSTVAIPATLTLAGSFDSLRSAIGDIQTGDRLFLVSGFTFTAPATDSTTSTNAPTSYTVEVKGIIYVLTDGSTLISSTPTPIATPAVTPTSAP